MADRPKAAQDEARDSILATVAQIPRGRVSTYGIVAARAGLARRARLVGRVLAQLPAGSRVPWQRVVAAGGRIAFPARSDARRRQVERLQREGVEVRNGRVDMNRFGWESPAGDLDRWLWQVGGEDEN